MTLFLLGVGAVVFTGFAMLCAAIAAEESEPSAFVGGVVFAGVALACAFQAGGLAL